MLNSEKFNKQRANAEMYFRELKPFIPDVFNTCLIAYINNITVIEKIINLNPNASYVILDDKSVKDILKINHIKIKKIKCFDEDVFDFFMVVKMSKIKNFDCIVMNPPYTFGKGHTAMHLEILQEALNHINDDGKIINLSPIGWLKDILCEVKSRSTYNTFKEITKHIENIEIIDILKSREIFGINAMNDLGVYTCSKSGGFDCMILRTKDQTSLFNKVLSKCCIKKFSSLWSVGKIGTKYAEKYHCNISVYHGHDGNKDFYDVCTPDKNIVRGKTKGERTLIINFNSDEEAENFRISLNTIFYKYLNFLAKRNQNLPLNALPFMGECINPRTKKKGYLSEWLNEDFYQYFGITQKEQKIIEETMKKYK